jgi:hypothetical protein
VAVAAAGGRGAGARWVVQMAKCCGGRGGNCTPLPTARSSGPSAKSALVKGPPPVDCVENPVDPPLPRA